MVWLKLRLLTVSSPGNCPGIWIYLSYAVLGIK
jgi:hypothetical protein